MMLEFITRFCLQPTSCSPAIRNTICSERLMILMRDTCPASVYSATSIQWASSASSSVL